MELVNNTPLAAHLSIGRELPNGLRAGLVLAKATFNFDERGRLRLDDQDPLPLFDADKPTPLGLLPRDNMPRNDPAFEVFLLGKAHAPFGKAVPHVRVSLIVGETKRSLDVYGDRFWVGSGADAVLSAAEPFLEMPLTYSRAFGGTADIEIDEDSPVEVSHPENPEGVGFDLEPQADQLHKALNCPTGFPRFARERRVPNVESPESPLRQWSDSPMPEAWSAVPLGSAIHERRSFKIIENNGQPRAVSLPAGLLRAHPGWVLEQAPAGGTAIELTGLTRGAHLTMRLPALRVHLDFELGDRTGSRELSLRALVLLPEENRFTLLYALPFEIDAPSGVSRSSRLRISEN